MNTLLAMMFSMLILSSMSVTAQYRDSTGKLLERFGLTAGMQFTSHSATFVGLKGIESCCPGYDGGSGSAPSFSLLYEVPFGNNGDWITATLDMTGWGGTFSRKEVRPINQNGLKSVSLDHSIELSVSSISVGLGYTYELSKHLYTDAGFGLGYSLFKSYRQTEELDPSFGSFDSTKPSFRLINEGDLDATSILPLNLTVGIGVHYEIPIDSVESMMLVPELRFLRYMASPIVDAQGGSNAVRFSLGMRLSPYIPPPDSNEIKSSSKKRSSELRDSRFERVKPFIGSRQDLLLSNGHSALAMILLREQQFLRKASVSQF